MLTSTSSLARTCWLSRTGRPVAVWSSPMRRAVQTAAPIVAPRFVIVAEDGRRDFYPSVGLGISGQLGLYWLVLNQIPQAAS